MRKNKDGSLKLPGQQFDEIERAQRKLRRGRIRSIKGSKSRDKKELEELGHDALKTIRSRGSDETNG